MTQFYKLTKISDDVFGGFHPNGIDEGYTIIGYYREPPKIGERFFFKGRGLLDHLRTSTVKEIVSESEFKTENSTYKLEIWDNLKK